MLKMLKTFSYTFVVAVLLMNAVILFSYEEDNDIGSYNEPVEEAGIIG